MNVNDMQCGKAGEYLRQTSAVGYMCCPRVYRFGGWLFERPAGYGMPWPIKEDGTPYKRAGRVFWEMVDRFERMSEEKRESYRDGGGCVSLEKNRWFTTWERCWSGL